MPIRPYLLILLLLTGACASPRPAPRAPGSRSPITLTYLGAAGWQLGGGKTTVLVDPYFSRPDLTVGAKIIPDEAVGRAYPHAPPRSSSGILTSIICSMFRWSRASPAPRSSVPRAPPIMRTPPGTPDDKIITVKGGEDFELEGFSLRVIPSLHSALDHKHTFGGNQTIPRDVQLPMTFPAFTEGGTLAYLVRVAGHEILFLSTANFIERELEGIRRHRRRRCRTTRGDPRLLVPPHARARRSGGGPGQPLRQLARAAREGGIVGRNQSRSEPLRQRDSRLRAADPGDRAGAFSRVWLRVSGGSQSRLNRSPRRRTTCLHVPSHRSEPAQASQVPKWLMSQGVREVVLGNAFHPSVSMCRCSRRWLRRPPSHRGR